LDAEEFRNYLTTEFREKRQTPNTIECLEACAKILIHASELEGPYPDSYEAYVRLNKIRNLVNSVYPDQRTTPENSEGSASQKSPLDEFTDSVYEGYYPRPEVMLALMYAFERYMWASGEKSLDEVFFGQPHKKTKSVAFLRFENFRYKRFQARIEEPGMKGKTLIQCATELLKTDRHLQRLDTDPETFLKGYRRFKRLSPRKQQ
jgi:hypothetical protein